MLAGDVGVHALHRDTAMLRDQETQPGRVEHGARAEDLTGRQSTDLLGGVGDDVDRIGDHHVDRIRGHLEHPREDGARQTDCGLGQFETRLTRLLLRTGGEDDDVGVRAHRHVVGADDVGTRDELEPVGHVEHLGGHLRGVDVEERDGPCNTPDERGVGDRGAHRTRPDDGQLRVSYVHRFTVSASGSSIVGIQRRSSHGRCPGTHADRAPIRWTVLIA